MSARRKNIIFPVEMVDRLSDLITAADDRKVVQTLREALDATWVVRAPRAEGSTRNNYVEIADWRVRVLAAKIFWEMKNGRPRQSVDLNVSTRINAPMSRAEAALELLENWDEVRRIGDEHVLRLKEAPPVPPEPPNGKPVQEAHAEVIDVDLE
jgi:hypothetical protein